MISCTLNQYKESFKTNLLAFLNEYEDNTKSFFLQNEKTKYQAYQKALTKIADQMKFFTREELNQNLVHRNIASDLKKLDTNIYNSIITKLKTKISVYPALATAAALMPLPICCISPSIPAVNHLGRISFESASCAC